MIHFSIFNLRWWLKSGSLKQCLTQNNPWVPWMPQNNSLKGSVTQKGDYIRAQNPSYRTGTPKLSYCSINKSWYVSPWFISLISYTILITSGEFKSSSNQILLSLNNSHIKHLIKTLQFKYFPQGINYWKSHMSINQSILDDGSSL